MVIPRIIHQIWFGSRPLPAQFARYSETWRAHHPGWTMKLWNEKNLPRLRNQALFDAAPEIVRSGIEQFRADIARYEILLHEGGLYVDVDFECRRSLDDVIGEASLFAGWEVDGVWLNNALLAATPGHPFVAALVEQLPASVRSTRRRFANHISGPRFLTRLYRELRPEITTVPAAKIYPYLWNELDRGGEPFPDALAVHHWNNKRRLLRTAS